MSDTTVLHKLLHVREREKDEAQRKQLEAVDKFEKVAKQLYVALKSKEDAEKGLEESMQVTATINKIKEQSTYIEALNQKIIVLQQQVDLARQQLAKKDAKLTEAHVEMKKIEKMIERRLQKEKELEKKMELDKMNEISIRQYLAQVPK
ncbi:MAG TPA: flagellar export protein FliJ [Pseudogracilibacillus sp.]|nr:flagellar export protein FliJ [Pseudogracilibacillus sp.]